MRRLGLFKATERVRATLERGCSGFNSLAEFRSHLTQHSDLGYILFRKHFVYPTKMTMFKHGSEEWLWPNYVNKGHVWTGKKNVISMLEKHVLVQVSSSIHLNSHWLWRPWFPYLIRLSIQQPIPLPNRLLEPYLTSRMCCYQLRG